MIYLNLSSPITHSPGVHSCYRIAQQDLVCNQPVDGLRGYDQCCPTLFQPGQSAYAISDGKRLYKGPGWIGNRWREVQVWSVSCGFQIEVQGVGSYWIAADGQEISLITEAEEVSTDLMGEVLLGPALMLALALQDVYCWHGSAVLFEDQAILFLGESGRGKSTLSRWLDEEGQGAWRRIGDDIMPVSMSNGVVDILPHFPQLKMPAGQQPSAGLPERLPLAAIYVLDRPVGDTRITIEPLGTQAGALALVRHTVASRLFDACLMASQLDFCVRAVSQVPVKRLVYPLQVDALPNVQAALSEDMGSGEAGLGAPITTQQHLISMKSKNNYLSIS